MAREFSVVVGINATRAVVGGRQFKQGADKVNRSNRAMQASTARTTRRMTAMITTLGRLRGVASLVFAGFLGVGGISAVIRTLATFQKSMSNVQALLGDRGVGGAMEALTGKARELGATTVFTASQAAEGMKFLTLAGFDALEVFQAVGPALELAQAGALGLGEAADIVSNVMQGFNINASRTSEVVDALAFVASRSNTNIQQLGQAMKFVAPVAGALKLSVQEVSAALGLLGNSGLQASLAGTGLRRVLSGLLNPSKEANKVLADMGLTAEDLVAALQDPTKGLTFVLKELEDAGLGAAEAFTLFGQRGAPAVLSLVGQTGKLEEFNEQMQNIVGTARTIGQVMTDNLAGDARIAISAMQEAILRLGEAGLLEFLQDTTKAFTAFIRGLADIDQNLDNSSEKVRRWAAAGVFMRENIDSIRKALVVLVAFMNRAFLFSLASSVVKLGLFAVNAIRVVAGLRNMIQATAVLALSMRGLGAAIAATGAGALAIVIGFLLDWILFSEDAESQNNKSGESFLRLSQKVERAAFEFNTLTEELREFAIADATLLLQQQETALIRMTRQLENASDATARITQAELDQGIALGKLAAFELDAESGELAALKRGTAAVAARNELIDAIARQTEAELLLSTTGDASAEGVAKLRAEIEANQQRVDVWTFAVKNNIATWEEALAVMGGAKDATKEFTDALKGQTGLTNKQLLSLRDLVKEYSKTEKKIEELTDSLALFETAGEKAVVIEKALGVESGTLARVQGLLNIKLLDTKNKLDDVQKAAKTWKERLEDLRDGSDKMAKLQRQLARDTQEVILEWIRGGRVAGELAEAMELLNEEFEKNKTKLDETCEKNRELRECMSDSARRMKVIWDEALRNIQDSFADAFRGAFDSFGDFADKLLDGFKDLFANIAAEKFLSGLFDGALNFGGGSGGRRSGGGGVAGTASSAGGLGSLLGGVGGALSSLAVSSAFFIEGAKQFLLGNATSGQLARVSGFAGGGAAVAGAGLGALSGGLANNIFGNRGKDNGKLSALGGAIGSIFGPLGAILGGAIGSFVSNLIGGGKKLKSATLNFDVVGNEFTGAVETVIKKSKSFFRGSKLIVDEEAIDLAPLQEVFTEVTGRLKAVADALGVDSGFLDNFTFSANIDVKGKSGEELTSILENLFDKTITSAIEGFIGTLEGVSDRLRLTVSSFRGDSEEFVRAFEAAAAIDLAFLVEPVSVVTAALVAEGKTLTESYSEVLSSYKEVVDGFDGSLGSLEALASATITMVEVQTALAAVLVSTGQEISALFQTSAQTVREALLSEEELFTLRKAQIDELVAQASTTTDPQALQALAEEINRLGLDAFNLLDTDQQATLGPEFVEFFEGLDDLFGDQIAQGLSQITTDNRELNEQVASTMIDAAQAQIDAANEARDTFLDWRDFLNEVRAGGGIRFNELQI